MAVNKETAALPEQTGTPVEPKKGRSGKLFTFLLIPLILIPAAGGAFMAYRLFGPQKPVTEKVEEKEEKDPKEQVYGEFMQIQNMIINPAGTSGQRFLMVSIGLECIDPKTMEELKAKEVVVRDTILKVLSERSVEELASISLRTSIKEKLREAVSGTLSTGKVDRLYFTEYVLQ